MMLLSPHHSRMRASRLFFYGYCLVGIIYIFIKA